MVGRVAVVTDSTAYLPQDLVDRHGITVVPLQVIVGSTSLEEGEEATSETVADALRRWAPVSTSRPSPEVFLAAYRAAAGSGATGVASIHLSAQMSGTHESAALAAREAPVPVAVIDSRSLGMGLGFAVLSAAEAAESGAPLDAVAGAARERAGRTSAFFYVNTLEYLRRGGRIGPARALVGSALAVKPLLHVVDGRIEPLEKVRTASRALHRLEEIAIEQSGDRPVDLAVHHLTSWTRARAIADRLRAGVPNLRRLYVREVGAVIGAHVGPGMVAVVVSPVR